MNAAHVARTSTIKADSRIYFAAPGRRITQLRKSRGYTQAEFARALGVSQQAVFAYELGDRRTSGDTPSLPSSIRRAPIVEIAIIDGVVNARG